MTSGPAKRGAAGGSRAAGGDSAKSEAPTGKGALGSVLKWVPFPKAATITAVATLILGAFGNKAVERHEKATLYAQLIAQREQSESQLRKDMFANMMEQFFKEREGVPKGLDFSRQLLQLEMLALNFGEAMSMGPLFHQIAGELRAAHVAHEIDTVDAVQSLERLEQLAARVSSWQLAALPKEDIKTFDIVWSAEDWDKTWPQPEDHDAFAALDSPGGDTAVFEALGTPDEDTAAFGALASQGSESADSEDAFFAALESSGGGPPGSEDPTPGDPDPLSEGFPESEGIWDTARDGDPSAFEEITEIATEKIRYDGIERAIYLELSNPYPDFKTVGVTVNIREGWDDAAGGESLERISFGVDFFDFPMIDNVRMWKNHRLALVLRSFDSDHISMTGVLFPGRYGSQRDKPFLDVVIQQLPEVVDEAGGG